jgi:hypothetical protein
MQSTQYKKDELEALTLDVIKKEQIWKIDHICAFLPCSRSTFYLHNLDKSDKIQEEIYRTKTDRLSKAIKRLEDNESASAQIATVKLLGDEDIRNALNGVSREDLNTDRELKITRKVINNRDDIAK